MQTATRGSRRSLKARPTPTACGPWLPTGTQFGKSWRGPLKSLPLVASPIEEKLQRRHAAPELGAVLAEARQQHVLGTHGAGRSDGDGLLSQRGSVSTEAPGALEGDRLGVEAAGADQGAIQREQRAGIGGPGRQRRHLPSLRIEAAAVPDFEPRHRPDHAHYSGLPLPHLSYCPGAGAVLEPDQSASANRPKVRVSAFVSGGDCFAGRLAAEPADVTTLDRDAAFKRRHRPRPTSPQEPSPRRRLTAMTRCLARSVPLSYLIARNNPARARRHGGVAQREREKRPMLLQDAIFNRRSVRPYAEEEIDGMTIRQLISAAIQAPNAVNEQRWRFIAVGDRKVLERISQEAKAHYDAEAARGAVPRALLSDPAFDIFYRAPARWSSFRGGRRSRGSWKTARWPRRI